MATAADDRRQYLFVKQAFELDALAVMLVQADDPLAKLEELRPYLSHPRINGGKFPRLFMAMAEGAAGYSPGALIGGAVN